jgi:hypothetical protein
LASVSDRITSLPWPRALADEVAPDPHGDVRLARDDPPLAGLALAPRRAGLVDAVGDGAEGAHQKRRTWTT